MFKQGSEPIRSSWRARRSRVQLGPDTRSRVRAHGVVSVVVVVTAGQRRSLEPRSD